MFKVGDIISNHRAVVYWSSEDHTGVVRTGIRYIIVEGSLFMVTALGVKPCSVQVSLLPTLQEVVGWFYAQDFKLVVVDV